MTRNKIAQQKPILGWRCASCVSFLEVVQLRFEIAFGASLLGLFFKSGRDVFCENLGHPTFGLNHRVGLSHCNSFRIVLFNR